jgi:hypothetical protein
MMRELFTAKDAVDPHNSGVYKEITARRQQKEWEEICEAIETAVILRGDECRVRHISDLNHFCLEKLGYRIDYHDNTDQYIISWWEFD